MCRRWVTWSICMPTHFWSTRFIFEINDHVTQFVWKPTFDPLSNGSETHFWASSLIKVDQKWVFEQFMVTWLINCSKTQFWSTIIGSNWIKSDFSMSLNADQNFWFKRGFSNKRNGDFGNETSTQIQKLSKNFKIEFPGNWRKTLISPESAWLTELFPIFWKEKKPTQKIIPIFHSGIQSNHFRFHQKSKIIWMKWSERDH